MHVRGRAAMKIDCSVRDRCLIVTLDGDIDHHTAGEIKTKIDKSFERSNAKNIIIDFQNVDFMDSSGIGALIGRYKAIENRGENGKLVIAGIKDNLTRLFAVSGLAKICSTAKDVDDAVLKVSGESNKKAGGRRS